MAYASRLYPRAKPRGFTLQWVNKKSDAFNIGFFYEKSFFIKEEFLINALT